MNYEEAVTYMNEASKFGVNLELETTEELLGRLNHPEHGMKYIHVAGTNGKGSVVSYLAHILGCQGYKVGRYISPAVFDFCERIEITEKKNGKVVTRYIRENDVASQMSKIKEQVEKMTAEGNTPPTCFELQTVLAFMEFRRQNCDFVILEVGLGGRYDSTNVIKDTLCSVITSISFDHCDVLGDTIEKIAYEKAGIIKEHSAVVVYDQEVLPELSVPVIQRVAKAQGSDFIQCDFGKLKNIEYSLDGTKFSYKKFKDMHISLLGKNQVKNAAVALEVVKFLRKKGVLIEERSVADGLRMTRWFGRMDVVSKNPLIIADGAHNEDAAKALEESIKMYLFDRPLTLVVGVFKDKDYRGILKHTAKYANRVIVFTTKTKRALPKETLAEAAKEYTNAEVLEADSIEQAIFLAKGLLEEDGAILTFGSLSFLGDVYRAVQGIGRAELVLKNKLFLRCQLELDKYETYRQFCRHDLSHSLDVARLMCLLSEDRGVELSKEYVYTVALLHDLGRVLEYEDELALVCGEQRERMLSLGEDGRDEERRKLSHAEASVILASEILPECMFQEKEIDGICDVILGHRHEEESGFGSGSSTAEESGIGSCSSVVGENGFGSGSSMAEESGFDSGSSTAEELAFWLKEADHQSRNCFCCDSWEECKWSDERKNKTIRR